MESTVVGFGQLGAGTAVARGEGAGRCLFLKSQCQITWAPDETYDCSDSICRTPRRIGTRDAARASLQITCVAFGWD
jgi:hypothetical protein